MIPRKGEIPAEIRKGSIERELAKFVSNPKLFVSMRGVFHVYGKILQ
jgi:hypothetical protein